MQSEHTKRLYTTHEVARLLGVTPITVIRWIESGKFKCFTTVGGHRRIEHDELVQFAQTYNLPWQGDEEVKQRKDFVVLAVDDEEDVLELLQDMLGGIARLKLITVGNGFTAGAKLVEERPDLVLLDFLMPELDGFEFCSFMRKDDRFKDVPIIAVTGLKGDADVQKMKEAGVNDLLQKPFTEDHLVKKIEHYRGLKKGG
ncbi:MAG: response regulator [Candidatus Omnitrophica bacterium]|nr:response regulator [Candidatus Omnitrophota bacterium]